MIRKLIEMAIAAGRKRQSQQTSLIHHHYHSCKEDCQNSIPLIENYLFALALFRSRAIESITEGKSILERLLHFQNGQTGDNHGNFPIYVHDYPTCHDWYAGIAVLTPLYWILAQFHHILGQSLKARTESAAKELLQYVEGLQQKKELPFLWSLKAASAIKAFGMHWQDAAKIARAEEWLEALSKEDNRMWLGCPAAIGEVLAALQMSYPALSKSPWRSLWNDLAASWHQSSGTFAGPSSKEFQKGLEPQVTLYDLYMGQLSGGFSVRVLQDSICHLQGALIQPFEEQLPNVPLPFYNDSLISTSTYALSLLNRNEGWNKATDPGFHPFRLVWGTPQRVHSLVCQGGNCRTSTFTKEQDGAALHFILGEPIESEDREKLRETLFYLDLDDAHLITVAGIPATTFRLEEPVVITTPALKIMLQFAIEEGEGQFMGHIMKGNRPAQIDLKGSHRHHAYDWQIFLRTVRRSPHLKLRASVSLEELAQTQAS
jgi:hypothetical protein